MTRAWLRKSLDLWERKHKYRARKVNAAHAKNDKAALQKWEPKLAFAGRMIRRRRAQLEDTLPMRLKAYKVATTLLGVVEQGGNNMGPMVSKIIHENGGIGPEPWCGDTMAYCYRHAGSKAVQRLWASVFYLGQLAGLHHVVDPLRGDLVRYTFDHVGMFEDWCDGEGNVVPKAQATHIMAIEGNTGSSGAVSDSGAGHDGVKRKLRVRYLVRDFLRVER